MLTSLKLSQKLYVLVAILLSMLLLIAGYALYTLKGSAQDLEGVYTDRVVPLQQLKKVADLYAVNIVDTTHKVRNGNLTPAEGVKNISAAQTEIKSLWMAYTATFLTDEEKTLVKEAEQRFRKADPEVNAVRDMMQRGDLSAVAAFSVHRLYPAIDPISETIGQLVDLQLRVAGQSVQSVNHTAGLAITIILTAVVVSFVLGLGLAQKVIGGIRREVGGEPDVVAGVLHDLARGNIQAQPLQNEGGAESVVASLNELQTTFQRFVLDLGTLSQRQQEGHHDALLPSAGYEGVYHDMVQALNQVLEMHQGIEARVLKLVDSYSRGQFNDIIEIIPHKGIDITLTVARVRQVLLESHEAAIVQAQIKAALDSISSSVLIADAQHQIAYLNPVMRRLLQQIEPQLLKAQPGLQGLRLQGQAMESLFRLSAQPISFPSRLSSTHECALLLADRHFHLTANPIVSEGDYLGMVVQWVDRTAEMAIEQEVSAVIAAAARGDFTQRIAIMGKEGFQLQISEGINALLADISDALADLGQVLEGLAKGDLTRKMVRDYEGTLRQLRNDSNQTVAQLASIINQIKSAADQINTAAQEISSGNQNLSQRTEQQASTLEETASSMDAMTGTVRQNADNAKTADQLARGASQVAVKGGQVVGQVVTTMNGIKASATRIVDIISVIDGIAFQTNILALNAAVEAARAGDLGKGFAVVAGEVRNLAQRSAAAAKEIKALITDSVDKVESGARLVDEAGSTMADIVSAVQRVTDIMSEISAASLEQTTGIEQINQSIGQMDSATQQNAALVEQAAAAADSAGLPCNQPALSRRR